MFFHLGYIDPGHNDACLDLIFNRKHRGRCFPEAPGTVCTKWSIISFPNQDKNAKASEHRRDITNRRVIE